MSKVEVFHRPALDVSLSLPGASRNVRRRTQYRALRLKVAALERENADLHTALFEAGQVHRRLCAPRLVRHGAFEIASEIFPVRYLPGDFFILEETGGDIVFALGDICGKGLAAGMWTTCVMGLVREHAASSRDPQAIIAGVNRELRRMSSLAPPASLFLARLDPASGRLEYCSAGHPPTLLLRANGALESLSQGGMWLGLIADAAFVTGHTELRAGDVLLAYSDGILEARNEADEEFGLERIEAQLRAARAGSAHGILFSVLGAVQAFAAPCSLLDDTSLVVVRAQ